MEGMYQLHSKRHLVEKAPFQELLFQIHIALQKTVVVPVAHTLYATTIQEDSMAFL